MSTAEAASTFPLPLLIWTSPAFPVGAYAYSHGLEWAVESGRVRDAVSLGGWLGDLLGHGAPRNESILVAAAYRAFAASRLRGEVRSPDVIRRKGAGEGPGAADGLATVDGMSAARHTGAVPPPAGADRDPTAVEVNALALALAGSRERVLETSAQGNAFVAAARAAWPCAELEGLVAEVPGDIAYPIAFAAAVAGHRLPLEASLQAMLLGVVGNLVSAAQRLGCLGQTDAQRVIAHLVTHVGGAAARAAVSTLDDLGGAAFQSDLAALGHETQYSRLFRS